MQLFNDNRTMDAAALGHCAVWHNLCLSRLAGAPEAAVTPQWTLERLLLPLPCLDPTASSTTVINGRRRTRTPSAAEQRREAKKMGTASLERPAHHNARQACLRLVRGLNAGMRVYHRYGEAMMRGSGGGAI